MVWWWFGVGLGWWFGGGLWWFSVILVGVNGALLVV